MPPVGPLPHQPLDVRVVPFRFGQLGGCGVLDCPSLVKWLRQHSDGKVAIAVVYVESEGSTGAFSVSVSEPGHEQARYSTYPTRELAFDAGNTLVRLHTGHSCGATCSGWAQVRFEP